jgi:small subunit ribosomal protein S18
MPHSCAIEHIINVISDEPPREPFSSSLSSSNDSTPPRSGSYSPIRLPLGDRRGLNSYDPPKSQATERMARLITSTIAKKDRDDRNAIKRAIDASPNTSAREDMQRDAKAMNLSKQITRRFTPGDVYAPHDLHWVEMTKWKMRGRPKYDAFDALDLKPLDHYRVSCLVALAT